MYKGTDEAIEDDEEKFRMDCLQKVVDRAESFKKCFKMWE